MVEKSAWNLKIDFALIPDNEEDLTKIQYLIADTIEAIGRQYGKVLRVRRGWHKLLK